MLAAAAAPGLWLLLSTPASGAAVAGLLLRIALWGAVLLAGAELGARLTGSRLAGASHIAWDGAAGLAVVIGLLLWIGVLPGGFRPRSVIALVLALSLVAVGLRTRPRARLAEGRWPLAVLALLTLVATAGLAWDRVPPVFFDSLVYHFAHPFQWLLTGRATPEAWSLHSWFPPGASLLYGLGLAVGGDAAANDANLLAGLLLLALLADVSRRLWGDAAAVLASLLALATPLYLFALAVPGADLLHGLFGFGALACWLLRDRDDGAWLRRAALFVVGAMLTKWLAALVPAALAIVLFALWPPAGQRRPWLRALALAAPGLVALAPWLISNVLVTGNPIAPVLHEVVGGAGLAPGGAQQFRAAARGGLPSPRDLQDLGRRLVTGDEAEAGFYPTPAWGWLPLILAPLLAVAARRERPVAAALAVAAAAFAVWLMTFRWERFLVAATSLLIVALAGALPSVWRRGGPLRLVPLGALPLALLTLSTSLLQVQRFTGGLGVALGLEEGAAFLARALPAEVVYAAAGRLLDAEHDRILLIGEPRHHRLPIPHVAPTVYNRHPFVIAAGRPAASADSITSELRAAGFSHVIVDRALARQFTEFPSLAPLGAEPDRLDTWLQSLPPPLFQEGGVALYELR